MASSLSTPSCQLALLSLLSLIGSYKTKHCVSESIQ